MTTRQAQIAYWFGEESAFGDNWPDEAQALPCPHDVGVFIGYDAETGNQMWKCTVCGEVSVD